MPPGTRFIITLFNLAATFMTWFLVSCTLDYIVYPRCLSPGPTKADYADLVMTLTMALSATAAFGFSCVRFHGAKTLWQDAQFRLAWVFWAMAIHGVYCLAQTLPVDFGSILIHAIILGMAMISSLCAATTRKYLRLHP